MATASKCSKLWGTSWCELTQVNAIPPFIHLHIEHISIYFVKLHGSVALVLRHNEAGTAPHPKAEDGMSQLGAEVAANVGENEAAMAENVFDLDGSH